MGAVWHGVGGEEESSKGSPQVSSIQRSYREPKQGYQHCEVTRGRLEMMRMCLNSYNEVVLGL